MVDAKIMVCTGASRTTGGIFLVIKFPGSLRFDTCVMRQVKNLFDHPQPEPFPSMRRGDSEII